MDTVLIPCSKEEVFNPKIINYFLCVNFWTFRHTDTKWTQSLTIPIWFYNLKIYKTWRVPTSSSSVFLFEDHHNNNGKFIIHFVLFNNLYESGTLSFEFEPWGLIEKMNENVEGRGAGKAIVLFFGFQHKMSVNTLNVCKRWGAWGGPMKKL